MDGWPVATDPSGNVFAAGIVFGDATSHWGINDTIHYSVATPGSGCQTIMVKYDSNGNYKWGFGTQEGDTWLTNIATDHAGNSFILGAIASVSVKIGSFTLTNSTYPNFQYFVAKFDPNGNVLWAKTDGGSAQAGTYSTVANVLGFGGIATDFSGNVYITSNFKQATTMVGTFTLTNSDTSGSSNDILIAKYDPIGNVVWATSAGGISYDNVMGLTVTPYGDIYIAGIYRSPSIAFGSSIVNNISLGQQNAFIARYNSSGLAIWANGSGGNGYEDAVGIASDIDGNVYLTGGLGDSSISFAGTTIINPNAPYPVLYLVKFTPTNSVSWYKTVGGSSDTYGYCIAMSPCNTIWVSGRFTAPINVDGHTIAVPSSSYDPVFIAGFSSIGTYVGSGALQSGGDDQNGIACDHVGNVYICSDYSGTPFVVGNDTLPGLVGADELLYVAKYKYINTTPSFDTTGMHQDTFICKNSALFVDAPFGYSNYSWNNGTNTPKLEITTPGTYWVLSTGSCFSGSLIDTFFVTQRSEDLSFSLGNDTITCVHLNLQVPIPGVSYFWQDGSKNSSFTTNVAGIYFVTISDSGCSYSDTITISQFDVTQRLRDTSLCYEEGANINLTADIPIGGIAIWSTGSSDSTVTVSQNGQYWVTVTDAGCIGSDTMTLTIEHCNCSSYLPNAFSPNNDGNNDYYHPLFINGCAITNYSFTIVDRWGEVVFQSNDPASKWNGKFNDIPCELGTYMYYLKYKTGPGNTEHTYKGDVTLVR